MTRVANPKGPLGLRDLDVKPKAGRTPMRKTSAKRAALYASPEGREARDYINCVKQLPCVVCGAPAPSIAHHCIHGRHGTRKASDLETIPLCQAHHDHGFPGGLYSGKEKWAALHGPDYSYIKATRERVREIQQSVDY